MGCSNRLQPRALSSISSSRTSAIASFKLRVPLLDHGTGEYSSLGHMHRGTVRVKTGDRVKQGDLLGQIGSGGDSHFPHLHYQLQMPSGLDFRADGLPARFENISFDLMGKPMKISSPKRGIFMEAH